MLKNWRETTPSLSKMKKTWLILFHRQNTIVSKMERLNLGRSGLKMERRNPTFWNQVKSIVNIPLLIKILSVSRSRTMERSKSIGLSSEMMDPKLLLLSLNMMIPTFWRIRGLKKILIQSLPRNRLKSRTLFIFS